MLCKLLNFVGGGLLAYALSDLLNNFLQKHFLLTHLKSAYKTPGFMIRVVNAETIFTINGTRRAGLPQSERCELVAAGLSGMPLDALENQPLQGLLPRLVF